MTRRSKAIVKFHPIDQKQLIDLINKASIQNGILVEREEISTELSKIRKNRQRVKFREEDRAKKKQKVAKQKNILE